MSNTELKITIKVYGEKTDTLIEAPGGQSIAESAGALDTAIAALQKERAGMALCPAHALPK